MGNRCRADFAVSQSPDFQFWPASDPDPFVGEAERLMPIYREILFKLDLVLETLASSPRGEWNGLKARLIDISGSGLKLSCGKAPSVSSLLELKFILPGPSVSNVQCAGRILRIDRRANDWEVAVGFTHIREADRERIIHYAFQTSCQKLRSQKFQEHAPS